MTATLESFVHSTLDSMGAGRIEVRAESGIWRAELPETARRFLGRAHSDLLYTFDLERWEEGTRLECLTPHSPLVLRLQAFAQARGAVAQVHIPAPGSDAPHQPYLMALFSARFQADLVREHQRWLGINILSSAPVKLKGDPLANGDLVEGPPPGIAASPDAVSLQSALESLSDQWNREMASEGRELQTEIDRRYRQEANELFGAVAAGPSRETAVKRLQDRMRLQIECRLEMALVVWMPARTALEG